MTTRRQGAPPVLLKDADAGGTRRELEPLGSAAAAAAAAASLGPHPVMDTLHAAARRRRRCGCGAPAIEDRAARAAAHAASQDRERARPLRGHLVLGAQRARERRDGGGWQAAVPLQRRRESTLLAKLPQGREVQPGGLEPVLRAARHASVQAEFMGMKGSQDLGAKVD
jgi:hypothetical protein